MSNGDYIINTGQSLRIRFLDAQSATSTGQWREVSDCLHKTFYADALETGATADIHASNAEAQPANSASGEVVSTLTPSVRAAVINDVWRWMKVIKTAGGTPAASTVTMEGLKDD